MAALLALRVEIEPIGGNWKEPGLSYGNLVTLLPPKKDLEVDIRPREGCNGSWNLKMGDSKSRISLASG
jgi:hypothetical protein